LSRAVMQQAGMFPGQEKKVMDFYRNNPERIEDLRGPILEEKAVDYILTQVKFDDSKTSLEELASQEVSDETTGGNKKKAAKSATKKSNKK
jgi:trigger factor